MPSRYGPSGNEPRNIDQDMMLIQSGQARPENLEPSDEPPREQDIRLIKELAAMIPNLPSAEQAIAQEQLRQLARRTGSTKSRLLDALKIK